ncbi:MAG: hypothetical protein HYR58_06395 [Acidobacteria bacterium]|nr:hypothetical protein [Acidobacteriota bacterium]
MKKGTSSSAATSESKSSMRFSSDVSTEMIGWREFTSSRSSSRLSGAVDIAACSGPAGGGRFDKDGSVG